jgi:hypothetical protein
MFLEQKIEDLQARVAALEAIIHERLAVPAPSPEQLATEPADEEEWKKNYRTRRERARLAGWPSKRWPANAVITLLIDHNPKRGASHQRFALRRTGMTVGEYVAAVAVLQPNRRKSQLQSDLSWDVGNGWIRIDEQS